MKLAQSLGHGTGGILLFLDIATASASATPPVPPPQARAPADRPDAYYSLQGADAIKGADAATAQLTSFREDVLGQASNGYQRDRLAQFMGQLSTDDLASLEKLQASVRIDGSAEQSRFQNITRMTNDALRAIGIDPTPRPDAAPGSDAAQAVRFQRAFDDELSAFESNGRKPTAAEAYDIVKGLMDTGMKSGWLEARHASPMKSPQRLWPYCSIMCLLRQCTREMREVLNDSIMY